MNQTIAHFFWKNFNSKFKKKCIEEVEKPVQKILEELKLKFTNELCFWYSAIPFHSNTNNPHEGRWRARHYFFFFFAKQKNGHLHFGIDALERDCWERGFFAQIE